MANTKNETLSAVLKRLGWRHASGRRLGVRQVWDADGALLGELRAVQVWAELRRRGLVG